MKIAISIPDALFEDGEVLAAQLQTSRSDLYARALAAFLGGHTPDRVKDQMNRVVDDLGSESDGFSRAASRRALSLSEW